MSGGGRRALLGAALLLGSCVYLNSLYNAQRLYDEAEAATWAGRDTEARQLYDSVVAKSARSYRSEPDGGWADDALYLLGRAYLRRGEPARAEATLRRALEMTDDRNVRAGARLHLGVATASTGDRAAALGLLNDALRDLESDELRAEGHLWRARILLQAGQADAGWWDLDQAAQADDRYRVPAGLELLRWGVAHGDSVRTREGVVRLLSNRDAYVREDSVRVLLARVAARWGPAAVVNLLSSAGDAAWPVASRDRLLLDRARFQLARGDELAAVADASLVADGAGEEVVEARILLARVLFQRAGTVEDLPPARAMLLPAVGDARVLALLESIRMVELLVERADTDGPAEALFAAAELARDELEARRLARALLLRYAETAGGPWRGKALLAALDLSDDPDDRPPVLRRMARMRNDPYVAAAPPSRAAHRPPPRVLELDVSLQVALSPLLAAAAEEARQLDVLARERSDTAR